jgi:hypothetical protein
MNIFLCCFFLYDRTSEFKKYEEELKLFHPAMLLYLFIYNIFKKLLNILDK